MDCHRISLQSAGVICIAAEACADFRAFEEIS
jgi:hypothetical protein